VHPTKPPAVHLYLATFNDFRALVAMLSSINYNDEAASKNWSF
jgi:hypothetical protein